MLTTPRLPLGSATATRLDSLELVLAVDDEVGQ